MLHPNKRRMLDFASMRWVRSGKLVSDEDFLSYAGCILTGTSSIERADSLISSR